MKWSLKKRKKAEAIIAELEKQKASGAAIKENKLIDAKGNFNKLAKEADNLANNKVLKREKSVIMLRLVIRLRSYHMVK